LPALITLTTTFGFLWALLLINPFRLIVDAVARQSAAREDAKISTLYTDSNTQEVTNGANPLESLRALETYWNGQRQLKRFILIGNSQTFSVLLSPEERASEAQERAYPDILLAQLLSSNHAVAGYRLSAPNISYMEVLWYVRYLLTRPGLKPDELIIQLNFETFRKSGIREGMLDLLADPVFAQAAHEEAASTAAYATTFQQAIDHYQTRRDQEKGTDAGAAAVSRTGVIDAHGFGSLLETKIRQTLDRSTVFRSRATLKEYFTTTLYLIRVHLLGITPITKRSIGGATLATNVSSLERVGDLCRQNGIRLVLFNAPQNPSAPLYRTKMDRQNYSRIVADLSRQYAARYFDFEDSIPANMWGVWIDGPDPIHFGRAAHNRLANLMYSAGVIATR
jgi:hypothetical protein